MYSDFQLTDSLWRRKLIPRWGMVKGLKGTRQNFNCSRVIKFTIGLRLNFLKPLMLKTPPEYNGGWIHLLVKKGNFLHNFILSKCKGSNHWSHLKKGKSWHIMSVPAAVCGEHEQESTWWPDQIFKFGGRAEKPVIRWHTHCGEPANNQTQA